jgi:hypothetical protein
MQAIDLPERGPLRAMLAALQGGVRAGEVALVHARAGSGKTALLIQLALDRLLRGDAVLHLSAMGTVDQVRDGYESQLAGVTRQLRPLERAEARLLVERHRVIHCTRGTPPDAAKLAALLDTLGDVMEFRPKLIVVDGWEPRPVDAAALVALAGARSAAIWVACTPESAIVPGDYAFVLELVPERQQVWLHARRMRDGAPPFPPLRLEMASFTVRDDVAAAGAPVRVRPGECALYSGGANGAEAAFGELAERWGVREVNFTFDGHVQARTRGAHPLTEQELAAGDVSLAYVSRRLRRGYGEGNTIRRVLQSLWHQVSRAQLVFVIGAIQEDGTVTGGTGWSVELARMWNKRLWVYDQDKESWFRWNGDDWVEGIPLIDAAEYCGTGTRYLLPAGRTAVEELMERSFGPAP